MVWSSFVEPSAFVVVMEEKIRGSLLRERWLPLERFRSAMSL
jgi:hypothetical protein